MAVDRLDKEQAAIVGAFTGFLASPLDELHEYVQRIMGRPVSTQELGLPAIAKEIKEAARTDFIKICREP